VECISKKNGTKILGRALHSIPPCSECDSGWCACGYRLCGGSSPSPLAAQSLQMLSCAVPRLSFLF
jgi:hypothetical protein